MVVSVAGQELLAGRVGSPPALRDGHPTPPVHKAMGVVRPRNDTHRVSGSRACMSFSTDLRSTAGQIAEIRVTRTFDRSSCAI
jgi:hypothetical protein